MKGAVGDTHGDLELTLDLAATWRLLIRYLKSRLNRLNPLGFFKQFRLNLFISFRGSLATTPS